MLTITERVQGEGPSEDRLVLPFDQRQIDARRFLRTDARAITGAFAAYIHPQNFVRVTEGP